MTKPALSVILALVVAFAAFMTYLNVGLQQMNDDAMAVCFKPVFVPDVDSLAVFYFEPGAPVSRGVMVPNVPRGTLTP